MSVEESRIVERETPIIDPPADPEAIETVEQRKARYRAGLKSQTGRNRLKATLLAKRDELKARDWDAHHRHLQDTDQMTRYLNMQQYGDYDEHHNYIPYQRLPNDICYSVPVIEGHVQQALMMLLKTLIEYECVPKDTNSAADKAVSAMAEALGNEDATRLMDELARYDEALNSIVSGVSHRLLIWGAHPENPQITEIPEYGPDEEYDIPAMKKCEACGYPNAAEAVECSECQATYLTDIPASKGSRPGPLISTKQVVLGENILHQPHMMGVKSDLAAQQLRHASYIMEIDYLTSREHAEWLYQTPITEGASTISYEMQLRQQQERATIQTGPEDANAWPDRTRDAALPGIERVHVWLEVSEYGSWTFDVDETLPDGTVLKAHTPMGDLCPRGFKFATVGDTIVKAAKSNKNRQWTQVLYGKRAGSSRGAGLQAAIVLQDIINDCFNLAYTTTQSSVPFRAVLKKFVQELPPAGHVVLVDGMPPNGVQGAVAQYPAQADSGAAAMTAEKIESAMTFILGTNSLTGRTGAPDQKAMATATGVAASVENANGRSVAPISQRVACDKEFRMQIIENIRDCSVKQQKKMLAERFGPDVADQFFKCDFRRRCEWKVVKNTDKPRSDALTLSVMMEYGTIAANFAKSAAPWAMDLLSEISDLAGLPFNLTPGRGDRREAENRLNKLAAIEEGYLKRDPQFLDDQAKAVTTMFLDLDESCGPLSFEAAQKLAEAHGAGEDSDIEALVPFYFMLNHDVFMDVYRDWLESEEARMAPAARKLVVIRLWSEHFKAKTGATALLAQFEAMVQQQIGGQPDHGAPQPPKMAITYKDAPNPIRRQMEAAAGLDPSAAEGAPEAAADAETDGSDDRTKAMLDHQLGEEAADHQLKRDLIKQGHKAETEIAVETAKAKLQPKTPAKPASNGNQKK